MWHLRVLFVLSFYAYVVATVLYAVWFFRRKKGLWIAGTTVVCIALATQSAYVIGRTVVGGRPPLANTFETLVFLAACVVVFFLVTAKVYGWKAMAPLASLAAFLVTLFAYLIFRDEVEPPVPALRDSFWLTTHVVVCFLSYAAFLLAYLGALLYLWKEGRHAIGAAYAIALNITGAIAAVVVVRLASSEAPIWIEHRRAVLLSAAGGAVVLALGLWPLVALAEGKLRLRARLPENSDLDRMVYTNVALGFPFLSLGIITGSIWASQAWNRYWGWDPKETASLVTWLVFAVYLHLRLVPKWRGPWVAWIAVAGFWSVLFTYFGVNYLLPSIHSYGG